MDELDGLVNNIRAKYGLHGDEWACGTCGDGGEWNCLCIGIDELGRPLVMDDETWWAVPDGTDMVVVWDG